MNDKEPPRLAPLFLGILTILFYILIGVGTLLALFSLAAIVRTII